MKKLLILITIILVFLLFTKASINSNAQNNQCDNVSNLNLNQISTCLDQLKNAKAQSEKATKPLENQIASIKKRVAFIEYDLIVKEKDIEESYKNLEHQQQILNATIRDYYIKSYNNSPLVLLLSTNSVSELTQILGYQKATADRDKAIITNIVVSITGLEERKKELEIEKANIVVVKDKLDKIVAGAKAYQATLANTIAKLSQAQQQLLAQKLADLNIPLYAYNTQGGCSSDIDPYKDPGFGGTKFGFFTYGVPNRVGLNQYGAWGRAKAGKGYEEILRAYYNFDSIETRDAQISVQGYSSYSLDEYVKRVYEVPDSWTDNDLAALKAQAIAARSYALAYTNNGQGSICTTEQCQVFKPDPKGGNWEQAVNATAGQVMIQGGQPIKAWFSSTHGGYIFSSGDIGWSGTGWTKNALDASGPVNSFSDLNNNAYDKNSPWFYCDWGGRSQYNKTAWLKSDEVADIVNVLLLAKADSSTQKHLSQVDKSNPDGVDTWDAGRVKQELSSRGVNAYNNVSGISISADFGSGRTSSINISGDGGSNSFSGSDFKNYFNLRAPANIQIVGPLYNVEQR